MGCNCKKAKKIHDSLVGDKSEPSQNGFGLFSSDNGNFFTRAIQGIIVTALLMTIFPLVAVYLLIMYIIYGSFSLSVPKFISKRLT